MRLLSVFEDSSVSIEKVFLVRFEEISPPSTVQEQGPVDRKDQSRKSFIETSLRSREDALQKTAFTMI